MTAAAITQRLDIAAKSVEAIAKRHDPAAHRPLSVVMAALRRLALAGFAPLDRDPKCVGDLLDPQRWRPEWGEVPPRLPELDRWNYLTMDHLHAGIQRLIRMLPADLDAVAGIARSGLLVAPTVAVLHHRPLLALDQAGKRVLDVGNGIRLDQKPTLRKILVVDDTIANGNAMREAVRLLGTTHPQATVQTAVVYATPLGVLYADYCAAIYEPPHYLQWNLLNAGVGEMSALDFDGILCEDCPAGSDDDGPRYLEFLRAARPLHLPRRRPIRMIVTARLEKYREETLDWLQRHGIRCERLVMGPWASLSQRYEDYPSKVVAHKAAAFAQSDCHLFIESDPRQARLIHQAVGRPVLCPTLERVLA